VKPSEQQPAINQELAAGLSQYKQGTCVSIDWVAGTALVNIPGGTVNMPMTGVPIPRQLCWVGFLGNQPICLGVVPRPPLATVTGTPGSGGLVEVLSDNGKTYMVAFDGGMTVTPTDRVLIDWTSGGTILCGPSADPISGIDLDVPVGTPDIGSGSGSRAVTFNPTDSGTQNGTSAGAGSYWTAQVYCGNTTLGGYFYGGQIASTIPDSARIDSVELFLSAARSSGSAPTIGLHSLGGKSGNLNVDSAVTTSGGTGWKSLPTSFGDALKTGSRLGIGTKHGGYHIFAAANSNNSGALRITYTV